MHLVVRGLDFEAGRSLFFGEACERIVLGRGLLKVETRPLQAAFDTRPFERGRSVDGVQVDCVHSHADVVRRRESSHQLPRPRTGELADRLNSIPKYVVSSTLEAPEWNNTTVLKGDVVAEVSKLKQELDGEIIVPASYRLGRTLMEHDLVDELRLVVFPVVLGGGERLFGEGSGQKAMRLVDMRTIGDGLAFLTYELVR